MANVSSQVLTQTSDLEKTNSSQSQNAEIPNSEVSPKSSPENVNLNSSRSVFVGTDKNGLPTGFTVADSSGNIGLIQVSSQISSQLPDGFALTSNVISNSDNALNILLAQKILFNAAGVVYEVTPSITINDTWYVLDLKSQNSSVLRMAEGSYLVQVELNVNSTIEPVISIQSSSGLNAQAIPSNIQTSILIDSTKNRILGQAIFVNTKGVK
jgi:hypothetical protein